MSIRTVIESIEREMFEVSVKESVEYAKRQKSIQEFWDTTFT